MRISAYAEHPKCSFITCFYTKLIVSEESGARIVASPGHMNISARALTPGGHLTVSVETTGDIEILVVVGRKKMRKNAYQPSNRPGKRRETVKR